MQRVADFSNRFRFRGIVAIARASNEPVTSTNGENDFSKVRSEGNYPINRNGNIYSSSRIVSNLPAC